MLSDATIHPSLATTDIDRARAWYADRLGWQPQRDYPGVLVYSVDGTVFTVYQSAFAGTARNTVAAWVVTDLRAEVARLRSRGLVFEDLDVGEWKTADGIATADGGALNAWFRDADGNWVTIVQPGPEADEEPTPTGVSAMIAAADLGRARTWYAEKLGLQPFREFDGELLMYRSGASRFSVYATASAGSARNTVAVWRVGDLRAEVAGLRGRGVVFEDYDFGDERTIGGILTDADGDEFAWFKDSEGNVLGVASIRESDGF